MKNRILTIACVTTAAALLAACTAVYKNSDACEQLMRSKLAATSPDTLKIAHTAAGIRGERVVVEGSIEHVVTAEEAASAAVAASAARAAVAASASVAASGPAGASAALAASAAAAAEAASAASEAAVQKAAKKSGKPVTTTVAAAAECTFHGPTLNLFSWLAPAKLVTAADPAAKAAD